MAGSLQDQLLKIGAVDKKKAKKSQHQKRKEVTKTRKAIKSGEKFEPQALTQEMQQSKRDKQQRDLDLNKQRDADRGKKALIADVRQIVQQHTVDIPKDADVSYNFEHNNKIKKLFITSEQQKQLILGQLAIVVSGESHALIPDKIAEKIESRLPDIVIRSQEEHDSDEDDPYADYQIPDDLMW
ncbi:MAG: DUF2058 domain-containing protein [Gammaproteobacteria bacterium]|nr:MAG: DUF2058 domain-containing protein [Gammaproteobacteria bacterium]